MSFAYLIVIIVAVDKDTSVINPPQSMVGRPQQTAGLRSILKPSRGQGEGQRSLTRSQHKYEIYIGCIWQAVQTTHRLKAFRARVSEAAIPKRVESAPPPDPRGCSPGTDRTHSCH
ncbi:unnamed protein product [Gadus morhua 'NCC']